VACALLLCTQSLADGCVFSDLDSDGEPDYAYVADCDSDGILEMEDDIQAAIDALTDDGSKLVEIAPGSFLPPLTAAGKNGIVELPSNITVGGAGLEATILNGLVATDLTSLQAVVSNESHGFGDENIALHDLEIDGGWFDGDASAMPTGQHRMGVFWSRCRDCLVEGVTIHDTLHACLYTKNGHNVTFRDNTLSRCGNYYGNEPTYSCVYVYADPGYSQEQVYITGNTCNRSGSAGISLRRANLASTLEDVFIAGNTVSSTRDYGSWSAPCMMLRGADNVEVTGNNVCDGTGGIQTKGVDDYYSNDVDGIKNLLLEDLEIRNSHGAGLLLWDYVDGAMIRRVLIDGTDVDSPCLEFTNPARDVVFWELTLRGCGTHGIVESDSYGSGHQPDEALTLRDVMVEPNGADEAALFRGQAHGMVFDGVSVTGAAGDGIRFLERLFDSSLRSMTVDGSVGDGVQFDEGASNLTIDRASISNTGGDGIHLLRGAAPDPTIVRIANSTFSAIGGRGVRVFADSWPVRDLRRYQLSSRFVISVHQPVQRNADRTGVHLGRW
jgi:hypothetical protein